MSSSATDLALNYKTIFEASLELYIILAPDGTILSVNPAYAEATLTKAEEIIGKNMFEVFPDNPDDPLADGTANLRHSLNTVVRTGQTNTMAVQRYDVRKADGTFEVRYWSPVNTPIFDEAGKLVCILHRADDVTSFVELRERQVQLDEESQRLHKKVMEMEAELVKRSIAIQKNNQQLEAVVEERTAVLRAREQELSKQNKKLEAQNRELEQFTYVATHDLQEPLRSLTSLSELMQTEFKEKIDAQGQVYLKFILQCTQRMQQLVAGLLTYARAGREKKREKVDCAVLMEEIQQDLSAAFENSGGQLVVEDLPVIDAYPLELRSLFQNLVSNALKFRRRNVPPLVRIKAVASDDHFRFEVQDNGIGIEQRHINKLFVIFRRLHNHDEYQGTGVGLALCKKIVDLHGGEIWVQSIPGEGSTFIFTIPR